MAFDGNEHRTVGFLSDHHVHPGSPATGQVCMEALRSAYIQARRPRVVQIQTYFNKVLRAGFNVAASGVELTDPTTQFTIYQGTTYKAFGYATANFPAHTTHLSFETRGLVYAVREGLIEMQIKITSGSGTDTSSTFEQAYAVDRKATQYEADATRNAGAGVNKAQVNTNSGGGENVSIAGSVAFSNVDPTDSNIQIEVNVKMSDAETVWRPKYCAIYRETRES